MIDESQIGKRIKQIRDEKGMTQSDLAAAAKISSTQLSGYENGKVPGLTTLAKIAHELEVSIDRLYYGDESESFITSAISRGQVLANSLCMLKKYDLIGPVFETGRKRPYPFEDESQYAITLNWGEDAVRRLIDRIEECSQKSYTFDDPADYIMLVKASVAKELD